MMNRRHSFDADKTRDDQQIAWSFPLMKMADIKDCLNALEVKVTETQLNDISANKQLYKDIMEFLAELCTGITREEILQPQFNGLQVLNNPELHDESIPNLHAFRAVSQMMKISGITDFSTKDMIAPSAKRMRRQLSGIINYAKFREERFSLLQDQSIEREKLVNKHQSCKTEQDKLNIALSKLQDISNDEEIAIKNMEEEVNSIENNISMLNTKQADIREEITELKSLNNSLKDGITARALELDEITSSVKTLNSQIVSSPERFRKNIIDVGHSLQAEQKDTKLAEKKQRELAGWLTYVEVAQVNVGEALDMMKIVRNEVEKQKSAQQEHNEIKSNTNELKNVLSSLESSVSTIHRQAQRSEEKVNILRQQHNSKISEGNNKINTLHSDILSIENHNNMVKSKADSAENDVIKYERAYNVEIQSNLSEINDMKSTYQRLEKSVLNHLKKFQNTLNQCNGNNHSNEIPPLPAAAVL